MAFQSIQSDQLKKSNKMANLMLIQVRDAVSLLWGDNPKEHDLGGIIESIQKYGLQELPVYDQALPGIKAGNGRTYALGVMEAQNLDLPDGVGQLEDGSWVMPLIVGTDAASEALAKAYAVDSNNLTMAGGNFTAFDMMKMWSEQKYLDLLTDLGKENMFPVSVTAETLDDMLKLGEPGPTSTADKEVDDILDDQIYTIRVVVKNTGIIEDIIGILKEVVSDNPEWDARLEA